MSLILLDREAVRGSPKFQEAVDAFRVRVPISDQELEQLDAASRKRAFWVAGVANLDVLDTVWEALDKSIAEGATFEEFREAVSDKLEAEWGGELPGRIETIFRTNVQVAYGAGRVKAMRANQARRPIWKYSAIEDSRTSEICQAADGTVLPADNAWWDTLQPPLHHGCRSSIIALTTEQAGDGVDDAGPDVDPDDGFGNVEAADDWKPELKDYPEPLRAAWQRRNEAA